MSYQCLKQMVLRVCGELPTLKITHGARGGVVWGGVVWDGIGLGRVELSGVGLIGLGRGEWPTLKMDGVKVVW